MSCSPVLDGWALMCSLFLVLKQKKMSNTATTRARRSHSTPDRAPLTCSPPITQPPTGHRYICLSPRPLVSGRPPTCSFLLQLVRYPSAESRPVTQCLVMYARGGLGARVAPYSLTGGSSIPDYNISVPRTVVLFQAAIDTAAPLFCQRWLL